jgi:hypothetical protein
VQFIDHGAGVKTRTQQSRLQVSCPYSPEFLAVAHRLGGRWRKRADFWSFSRHQFPKVAKALNACFGTSIKMVSDESDN